MPSGASTAECTEHILSIQPTREELMAFHALHIELLSLEDSWPRPVVNFIHRWMHCHSLYNICPSKASTLSTLTSTLMLLAKLPTTDDIREKVAQKCASLVIESALKWVEEGLLLQRGHSLGKRTVLRDVWAVYVGRFHELETAILGEVTGEGRQGSNSSRADSVIEDRGGSKKREANTHLSHDIAKIPRTDDCAHERVNRDEAALPQPHEMPGPSGDSRDCIIVGVGESSLLELGLAECSSPRKLDATYHQSPLDLSTDSREGTSLFNCMEEGGAIPFQSPPSHDASDVLNIRQDQIQEIARDRTSSDQRPSTVLGYAATQNTAPQSHLAPDSTTPQHPSTIVPNSYNLCSSEQAPEMQSNTHIPRRSLTQRLISAQSSPSDPPRQTSEHFQEPSPQSSTTQASLIASVDMGTYPFTAGPPHPDNPGFSPQVSNHVKHVRPGDPTTLEPLITIDGPPSTPPLNLPRISPTNASQHTRSPNSSTQKSHSPALPFMEARPTARSGPHITSSRMFQIVGRILTPDYDRPGRWSLLHVDTLMLRNVTEFYGLFSRLVQPGRALPVLRFELLDMAPELVSNFSYPTFISCRDHINFQTLKRSVFGCFQATIAKHPTLQMFRIMVTPDLAPLSRQASVDDSAEGRGNSSSGAQLPAMGSNSSSAILAPFESRLGPQDTPTRPISNALAPSHNETGLGNHPTVLEGRKSRVSYPVYAARETKHVKAVTNINSPLLPAVVVRIQVNKYGSVSEPFPKTVLAPKVTNAEFFAWFANQTGYSGPIGPAELSFSFKDVVPTPKNNVITRGNEEHFEYMKRDIRPMCELTTAKIPGLSEFAILVTVPGWVLEKQDETW